MLKLKYRYIIKRVRTFSDTIFCETLVETVVKSQDGLSTESCAISQDIVIHNTRK